MPQDIERFVAWLKSAKRRMAVSDDDLLEMVWQVHPRFRFFKSLPWGANLLDLGAGDGGLAHWKGWLKPQRPDLNLYGVDLSPGAHKDLYAGWESINLDREQPSFPGAQLNGFIAGHMIEYLATPELLIEWLASRCEIGGRLYFEWSGPTTLDLPTREQLLKYDIDLVTSNFADDREHEEAPDLTDLCSGLTDSGLNVVASGAIDLGILGEEMFARGRDRYTRSMGYWSMTRSSLYAVAIKPSDAAAPRLAAQTAGNKRPIVQIQKRRARKAVSRAPWEPFPTQVPFDPSAVTVRDADLRRFAFGTNHALAPASRQYDPGSLEIHWVIPDFCPGAGGHMTIFRICNRLEASGHRLSLWIRDPLFHDSPAAAKETLNRHFQPISGPVRFTDNGLSGAAGDIIVATDAWTVPLVFSARRFKRRFYLVQDFEPAFVPVGTRYLAAESTYRRDLDCICGGPWLEQLMRDRYGRWARKFWLAADPTVYYPSERSDETGRLPHIAFYFRAFTDRRAVELGLLALELLARRGIQFHVDFFGQHELPFSAVPYAATNHGVCDTVALAQLYQTSTIGVVFSATNYSIVPQEMMACGLPVLDLDIESTRGTYDPAAVRLAIPDPQGIADAIEAMLADPTARQVQAEWALSWISQFSWSQSASLVETAFRDRLVELGFTAAAPTVSRSRQPFATVVIPTLDGGDLLHKVVDSVLAQRLPGPLQLICIDSASTDGTAEYLATHPGVELISIDRNDFQHGRTRNLGVGAAAGEFVAFLTQDALPVDDCWLYNLICCLINHPNAGGVFGRHIAYPSASEFIKQDLIRHFAGFDELPVCVSLEDPKIREMFAEISGRQRLHFYSDNNSGLRKSVWQTIPFPEVEFGEDQLFALELLKQGYGKAYSRHAVVYHSHDDPPEIVEERAYTEAKFFYEHFGYRLLHSEAHAEQSLAGLNAADQRMARERSLPSDRLERRLSQNAARIAGYRRMLRHAQR